MLAAVAQMGAADLSATADTGLPSQASVSECMSKCDHATYI